MHIQLVKPNFTVEGIQALDVFQAAAKLVTTQVNDLVVVILICLAVILLLFPVSRLFVQVASTLSFGMRRDRRTTRRRVTNLPWVGVVILAVAVR